MNLKEFEMTLWFMGIEKRGNDNYISINNRAIQLHKVMHRTAKEGVVWEYLLPNHFTILILDDPKTWKQLHGYQRIINYLNKYEQFKQTNINRTKK